MLTPSVESSVAQSPPPAAANAAPYESVWLSTTVHPEFPFATDEQLASGEDEFNVREPSLEGRKVSSNRSRFRSQSRRCPRPRIPFRCGAKEGDKKKKGGSAWGIEEEYFWRGGGGGLPPFG